MFVGALSPQHAGWQCMLTGMLVQAAMGAMTGKGMRSNGTDGTAGAGSTAALTPQGMATGTAGGQLHAWQPAHGLVGGGAAAVLLRA